MSIHAVGSFRLAMLSVAFLEASVPAGKIGSFPGAEIPNSSWKSFRITLESSKSSLDDAICGWVAYAREAARALSSSGTDLEVE